MNSKKSRNRENRTRSIPAEATVTVHMLLPRSAYNLTTNNEKSMVIENVSIENVNESEISGSMTLNMYVLKKLADPSAS